MPILDELGEIRRQERRRSTVTRKQLTPAERRRVSMGYDFYLNQFGQRDLEEEEEERIMSSVNATIKEAEERIEGVAPMNEQEQIKKRQRTLRDAGEFRCIMYDLVDSRLFTVSILMVILLNTCVLIAQSWQEVSVLYGWYFSALDNVFLGIYIMEIVLKLYVFRKSFFKEGWNVLDLMIVVFNVVDFVLPLVLENIGGFNGAAIFRLLRIFRAVRAIRALRVLRAIRFLANLQVIMATCLQSIQSMSAIVILISLFMYMFAVIGRGLYAEVDPDRFGNLMRAAFTLFQLMTLDDWYYIYSDVMAKDDSRWHIVFYLLLYIVVEYFVFLNLFVAVLVDNFQLTLEAANEASKKKRKHEEDSDDEEDVITPSEISDGTISTHQSEVSARQPRKTIDDCYPKISECEREALSHYFQLLVALEYNIHTLQRQQRTIDMMADMCVETNDDL